MASQLLTLFLLVLVHLTDNNEDTVDLFLTSNSTTQNYHETIERLELKGLTGIVSIVDIIESSTE